MDVKQDVPIPLGEKPGVIVQWSEFELLNLQDKVKKNTAEIKELKEQLDALKQLNANIVAENNRLKLQRKKFEDQLKDVLAKVL